MNLTITVSKLVGDTLPSVGYFDWDLSAWSILVAHGQVFEVMDAVSCPVIRCMRCMSTTKTQVFNNISYYYYYH